MLFCFLREITVFAQSSSTVCIEFDILEDRERKALPILLANADCCDEEANQLEANRTTSLDEILDKCAGLSFALAIAGRTSAEGAF